jgi:hypothetical protein
VRADGDDFGLARLPPLGGVHRADCQSINSSTPPNTETIPSWPPPDGRDATPRGGEASTDWLLDDLVRPCQQRRRDREPERLGRLHIHDQLIQSALSQSQTRPAACGRQTL